MHPRVVAGKECTLRNTGDWVTPTSISQGLYLLLLTNLRLVS
jgi:hypothetical protein